MLLCLCVSVLCWWREYQWRRDDQKDRDFWRQQCDFWLAAHERQSKLTDDAIALNWKQYEAQVRMSRALRAVDEKKVN
jgi:hypothetical protein